MQNSILMTKHRMSYQLLSIMLMLVSGLYLAMVLIEVPVVLFQSYESLQYEGTFGNGLSLLLWLPINLALAAIAFWCANILTHTSTNFREWRFALILFCLLIFVKLLYDWFTNEIMIGYYGPGIQLFLLVFICLFVSANPIQNRFKTALFIGALFLGFIGLAMTIYGLYQAIINTDNSVSIWKRLATDWNAYSALFFAISCIWIAHAIKPFSKIISYFVTGLCLLFGLVILFLIIPSVFEKVSLHGSRLGFLRALTYFSLILSLTVFFAVTFLDRDLVNVDNAFRIRKN